MKFTVSHRFGKAVKGYAVNIEGVDISSDILDFLIGFVPRIFVVKCNFKQDFNQPSI